MYIVVEILPSGCCLANRCHITFSTYLHDGHCYNIIFVHKQYHRPHSGQVTKQLPWSSSFHSHKLVCLKASNVANSEYLWHFNVNGLCISHSSFGQHYACLTIISRCVLRESRTENCIWPIFTCVRKTFDTHKRKSTSIACCAFAQQCIFRGTFPLVPWTYLGDLKIKFSMGRQRVAPHGTTQTYLETLN